MKKLLTLLTVVTIISCTDNGSVKTNQANINKQLDSLIKEVGDVSNYRVQEDSIKKVLLKSTFMAGYKQGVNTGINNSDASIKMLYTMASVDSLKFAKFVDETFK